MNIPPHVSLATLVGITVILILVLLLFVNVISTLSALVGLVLGFFISEARDDREA